MLISPSKVRRLAAAKGWNQSGLSRETGLSKSYLSQVLSGDRNPSPLVVKTIATTLGVQVSDLGDDWVVCPECGHAFTV